MAYAKIKRLPALRAEVIPPMRGKRSFSRADHHVIAERSRHFVPLTEPEMIVKILREMLA